MRPAARSRPGDGRASTPGGGGGTGCEVSDGLSRTGEGKCVCVSVCETKLSSAPLIHQFNRILKIYWTVTSWNSCDISHTKQELLCISHLCRSDRKKSRNSGVCVSAWTMQFMKHVFPRFIRPRSPEIGEDRGKLEQKTG